MPCFSVPFYIVGCPCCTTSASLVAQGLCCLCGVGSHSGSYSLPCLRLHVTLSSAQTLSLLLQEAFLEYPPVLLMPRTMAQVSRCLLVFGF